MSQEAGIALAAGQAGALTTSLRDVSVRYVKQEGGKEGGTERGRLEPLAGERARAGEPRFLPPKEKSECVEISSALPPSSPPPSFSSFADPPV